MKNNVLDDFQENENSPYAKKSFKQFWWSLVIYFFFIGMIQALVAFTMSFIFSAIILLMLLGGIVLNISGLRNGLKSIRLNEQSNWKKYVGAIGNLLILLLVVALLSVLSIDVYNNFIR